MNDSPESNLAIADYPIRKILRCLMFKYGDVEFPIEACVDFVADVVFPHVQNIVQKTLESSTKRNACSPEVFDIVVQFRRNPKLLKRLFEYVSLVNTSHNVGKIYKVETKVESDDDDEYPAETEATTSTLAQKVLDSIKHFDKDGKLSEFVTSGKEDNLKIDRIKKVAARAKSMSREKYERYSEASSYSFLLVGGKRSPIFEQGFRHYIKAPKEFDNDMLIILNFCALEMMTVLVEGAYFHMVKNLQGLTFTELTKFATAIPIENYKEAAKHIPMKKA